MEIRVLKYFLAVAREENITRAAESLNITQPTLSRQLMQLEEELKVQLFIRSKSKIVLTDKGMLLRRMAEEIVGLAEKTENEFSNYEDIIAGEIFIGSGETNSMHSLAKVMKDFHDLYPQVQYNLYSANADDIKEKIDKGLIDIGLLTEPVDISKYDFVRLKEKEVWGVLISKDYVTADDLIDKPLISSRRGMIQNEIFNWFGKNYDKLNIISTYNLVLNASVMVEEGLGYAFSLENLINVNDETNICFKPIFPKVETGTVIVWKKHQIFSSATTKFIEEIKSAFKEK